MKDNLWLDEVAETCTITLNVLQKKAETMGRLSHADQTMTDLCLGYLYLLSTINQELIFNYIFKFIRIKRSTTN